MNQNRTIPEGKFELPVCDVVLTCEVLELMPVKLLDTVKGSVIIRKVLLGYNSGKYYNRFAATLFGEYVDSLRVGFIYDLSINIQATETKSGDHITNLNIYYIQRKKPEILTSKKQIQS